MRGGRVMNSMAVVAAATLLVPLTTALQQLTSSVAGCRGVASMTRAEACLAACGPAPLRRYALCLDTLRGDDAEPGRAEEVTAYAVAAARRAARAYDAAADRAERLILSGCPSERERGAYQRCISCYGAARAAVARVEADLAACAFGAAARMYRAALAAVRSCGAGLPPGSPLAPRNAADGELTVVAYALGRMLFGKHSDS